MATQRASSPVVGADDDRGHIPVMTSRIIALRAAQLVLAIAYMALVAFVAVRLDDSPGSVIQTTAFALSFIASSWILLYFAWLGYSINRHPKLYHWATHLTLEILSNLLWVASWAMLAILATNLNQIPDGDAGQGGLNPYVYNKPRPRAEEASTEAKQVLAVGMMATRIIVAAASGIGMLTWGLLTTSLISTSISIVQYRKNYKELKAKEAEPVQEIIPESSFDFD